MMNTSKIIPAGELSVGMRVAERDGFLLDVREIVKSTPKTITLKLGSDFAISMRAGATVTLRKTSKVRVFSPCVDCHETIASAVR